MQRNPPVFRRLRFVLHTLWLALLLSFSPLLHAQIAGTGSIQGTVTDATGAVLPNATVTITKQSTLVSHTAKTDGSGVYVFPNIEVGTYTLNITAPGFASYSQKGNVLEVGSSISLNVKMTVGSSTENVEVQADSLALQTEDATFKQTIDSTAVTEMPLNGRQMTALVTLSGGSAPAAGNDFTGSKYSYATIAVSIAGGQGNTTLWRLDGGDNNDYMGNGNLPFPFPDAVSQFSVESSVLGAQDGMHIGGLVNVVTRSGTNTYHGSAFEFIRNNFIDATNFYVIPPNGPGSGKDILHQNQYGGTFGGKILKDKLFAFAGYQFEVSKQLSSTTTAHVPTAANLAGDFSVTAPATAAAASAAGACNTTATKLVDPLTGVALPGNKYNQPGGPALPAWNAQSLALQKYLPPINPNVDIYNCGVVQYAAPNDLYDKQFITRVDYTINTRNNMYGRYLLDGYQLPSFFSPTNILITAASGNPLQRVQTFTLGENFTASSNLVNSAHISILRRVNDRGYNANDINAGTLGVNTYQGVANGLQLTTTGGVGGFTIGGGSNSVAHFNDNTLAFGDEITWVHGKHQMVMGGEYVRNQLNISNAYESNGIFGFTSAYSSYGPYGSKSTATQNPNYNVSAAGDSALDFLEGTMNSYQQSKYQQNALRAPIPSLYFQDTFHAGKQLTLVAGLRWSPEYEPVDTKNRGLIFSPTAFLSNQFSTVYSGGPNNFTPNVPNGAPAGALFYGDPGVPRAFTKNSPYQFDPNLGFSYDLTGNGKTVVRAGAEYIYDEPNFFTGQRNQQNPPFATAITQTSTGYVPFSSPWAVPAALSSTSTINGDPFPQPVVPTPGSTHFFPNSQYIVPVSHFLPMRTMQWTASIQQELPHGWQVQFDYIGNKSSHIELGFPLNPVIYIPGNWSGPGSCIAPGTTLAEAGTGSGACSQANSTSYLARSLLVLENPTQGQGYSPGGGGSVLISDEGMANYNGLIVSVNHRLSSTFSLLANWTWSKCLDIADEQGDIASTTFQNQYNPAGDYGPCGFDYRDIENVVLVAKSGFHFSNAIEKALVDDWELAPLVHIQTGAPFNVTLGSGTSNDDSLTDVNEDRPNLIPGVPIYHKVAFRQQAGAANREYLNPAAFTTSNPAGTFGDISRNAFRTPPALQMDAQVSRLFPIHERLVMDLRLEAFNVLNHPNFGAPTSTTSSGTFGQIASTQLTSARVFQGAIKFNF
jgi:hypothetical protein